MPPGKKAAALLQENDLAGLLEAAVKESGIIRGLISLTYDKEDALCWRAIEAIGIISGGMAVKQPEKIRNLVQRLLWMLRDESGNNVGSAPEILGEIVRNSPDTFSDIAPIIASFEDEEMLRRGVLRALVRISEKRPDLVMASASLAGRYLGDQDAVLRAYAVLLAGRLGLKEYLPALEDLARDTSCIRIYKDGELRDMTVGKIAGETAILLRAKGG